MLYEELTSKTQGHGRSDLARVWADNVGRALAFLRAEGGDFAPVGEEEYMRNVLHPPRPARLGREWRDHGPDRLITSLWRPYMAAGGEFRPGRRAVELIVESGAVVGVVADTGGNRETYRGRAVLLCDGGFQANPELVARHITTDYKLRGSPADTGDALQMGLAIGAKAVNLEWFYGHLLTRDSLRNDALWPGFGVYQMVAAGISVDGFGRRFADEGVGDEILVDRVAKSATPGGCWAVFDDDAWESAGRLGEMPLNPNLADLGGGTALAAPAIEALADEAGLPVAALSVTVETYNSHLQQGTSFEPARTGPRRPIKTPPFHAIPLIAGITFAMGGLLVNACAQVLDQDEKVIPGLYAAGGPMGGLQGGPGFGYSGGWSEASTFGLLAAEQIATQRTPSALTPK